MKLSELDQALLRYADTLSPKELSAKIDFMLTPEQVAARISQLLEARDWLDRAQQDRLVTLKLRQLIVELEEAPRTTRNAEVLIRALEALGNRLDRRMEATERDLQRLYAFQGAVMLDAVSAALNAVRTTLTATPRKELPALASPPSTDPDADGRWDEITEIALRRAQTEIGKHE